MDFMSILTIIFFVICALFVIAFGIVFVTYDRIQFSDIEAKYFKAVDRLRTVNEKLTHLELVVKPSTMESNMVSYLGLKPVSTHKLERTIHKIKKLTEEKKELQEIIAGLKSEIDIVGNYHV